MNDSWCYGGLVNEVERFTKYGAVRERHTVFCPTLFLLPKDFDV